MKTHSKIYVAGHRGLLGSALVRCLHTRGYDRLILKTHRELDLTSQIQTLAFFEKEQPEYVFVAAAKVGGIKANMQAPGSFLYENVQIQNNIIEASRIYGVTKLLFVGSSCIYPKDINRPIREEDLLTGPLEPTNEGYAIAKIAGIRMCQFYRRQYGCNFISAIPTNLYGPGDHYDLERSHLVPAMILKLHLLKQQQGTELEVWGSGKPRREFMFSDDCADALIHLMLSYADEAPINVGIGEDLSVVEIAETIARVVGTEVKIVLDPTKPDGMLRKVLDVKRLTELGWTSRITLEQGIRITYDDFMDSV
ncbi:GDP-L-fucose synthase [bacterium]|nr:GDP-L-fucose synthase [bacterium]